MMAEGIKFVFGEGTFINNSVLTDINNTTPNNEVNVSDIVKQYHNLSDAQKVDFWSEISKKINEK